MFKISRLITTPKPGTNVFPAGTCDVVGDVAVVGVPFTAGGDCSVFMPFDEAVGAVGASAGASTGGGSGGCSTGGGGSGGGGGGAANGLAGFTGLVMFVGLVALFTQLSCAVIQSPHKGSLYGVEQVDIRFSVIEPTKPS